MRIVQLLPTMAMGDAIGNDVLALSTVIRNMGFQTGIYAETVDRRLPEGTAFPVEKMPRLSGEDVIISQIHRHRPELLSGTVSLPQAHDLPQHHPRQVLQGL